MKIATKLNPTKPPLGLNFVIQVTYFGKSPNKEFIVEN